MIMKERRVRWRMTKKARLERARGRNAVISEKGCGWMERNGGGIKKRKS